MKIALVHWNPAEAEERAATLRRARHRVVCITDSSPAALRELVAEEPEAVVVDLSRLPAQGRELGGWLRRKAATREVRLIFVGGAPEKVAATKSLLPDATYAEWAALGAALRAAAKRRPGPAGPVVPGTFAGYSGTPLPRKLGIKDGSAVALVGAPGGFERTLGGLPTGARLRRTAGRDTDVLLLFAKNVADLERGFPAASKAVAKGGRLWICWPKKASGLATDLAESDVRACGLARGWVDYKICAVDATWSGLCFARRGGHR